MLRNVATRSTALGGASFRLRPGVVGFQNGLNHLNRFGTIKAGNKALVRPMNPASDRPWVRQISSTNSLRAVESKDQVTTTSSTRGVFSEVGEGGRKSTKDDEVDMGKAIRGDLVSGFAAPFFRSNSL
jgi:hypothetical protein